MNELTPVDRAPDFLAGGGEMGALMRAHDWSATPLGPPKGWPPGLRTTLRVLLTTGHPIFIFWGPEHICFYNDAYRRSLGPEKHPSMLGARGREAWQEIWDIIGPQIETVMAGGAATWHENHLVPIIRHGERQEVYWTYSYGPIHEESAPGAVGGVLVICTETTERKRAERKLLDQKRILEMVAAGAPLADTLDELMRFVEAQELGARSGILVVTDDGAHFCRGSGPSLPESYHRALDGVPITPPYLGACGQAAHEGVEVVVPDVEKDTRFADAWKDLLRSCGLAACRSTPVRGADGRVLGSLAVYYDRPRNPTPANPGLIESAAHLAAIALERRRSEQALARDLAAMQRLQHISTLLIQEGNIEALYDQILAAAMALMQADTASMQLLDPERGELRLLAWKGLHPESATFWEWVSVDSGSSCGAALASGGRIVVPDIEACDFILGTPDYDAYRTSDVRAVQSTPLVSRTGRMIGMVSTHWRAPHRPSERDLRLLDVLVRQVADLIERSQGKAALREREERLQIALKTGRLGAWQLDLASGRLVSSDQCKANFGLRPEEELTYERLFELIHPEERERVRGAVRQAIEMRTDYDIEYRTAWPNGETHWIVSRGRAAYANDGTPLNMTGVTLDITERKRAETDRERLLAQLAGERERLQLVADAMPALISEIDAQQRYRFVNKQYKRWFGRTRSDIQGRHMREVVGDAAYEMVLPHVEAALAGRRAKFEALVPYHDGPRHVAVQYIPRRGGDGALDGFYVFVTDISERKRAEEQVRRSEERYRSLTSATASIVFTTGPDGAFVEPQPSWEAFTGQPWREHQGWGWLQALEPEDRDQVEAAAARAVAGRSVYESEGRLWHAASRTYRDYIARAVPILNADGTIREYIGTVTDVTIERRTERALRDSEERYRLATRAASDIIWDWNIATGEVVWNETLGTFGYAPQEVPAHIDTAFAWWTGRIHPEDAARVEAALRDAFDTGKTGFSSEYRFRRSDGSYAAVIDRGVIARGARGEPIRMVGAMADITERKRAEERQLLLVEEVNHRAKNLLAVVQSILQLSTAEDTPAFVAAVKGRVMALARAHSLLAESSWEGADLGRLVDDELEPYRTDAARIAASGPPATLRPAAGQALSLALHELATNAAKYGALSRARGRVAVTWEVGEEGLVLTWSETGGPAVAAPPTRRGFGSTLIGAGIEQQLGGRVTFDWRPQGLHATITVPDAHLVPTTAATAGDGRKPPAVMDDSAPPLRLAGRRVLVIEDEPLIAMDIETALADQGCTVLGPASSIEQALALAGGPAVDAAVLDRNLAGVSSEPVAALLRDRGIPFVVVTGYAGSGSSAAFDGAPVLAKPFELEALTSLVARQLPRRSVHPL